MKRSIQGLLFLLCTALLLSVLGGCAGSHGQQPAPNLPRGLSSDLQGLESLSAPEGVDPAIFAQLKAALRAELERAAIRGTSAAGQGTEVTDLTVTPAGASSILRWTYRNSGDYDQNSEVNISDVTPLAVHFGKTAAAPNWEFAQVADGDGNGEVNISDVTPIGANYRCQVTGYQVQRSLTGLDGTWVNIASVPFSAGTIPAGEARLRFEFVDPGFSAGMQYRVLTDWEVAGGGGGGPFVEPPVQTYQDNSDPGDSAVEKWLVNAYAPLPAWQDADRVFQSIHLKDWADEVLALTNQERANNGGLTPLTWDPHLELVAQAHAREMALRQYFDHDNPDGVDPFERLDAVQPAFWVAAAENLFAGIDNPLEQSPQQAVDGWMNSPGHRANILNPALESMGVGVYYHTGDPSFYTAYFVQLFATFTGDPNAHDWLEPAEVP